MRAAHGLGDLVAADVSAKPGDRDARGRVVDVEQVRPAPGPAGTRPSTKALSSAGRAERSNAAATSARLVRLDTANHPKS